MATYGTFDQRAGPTGLGSDVGFVDLPAGVITRDQSGAIGFDDDGYYTLAKPVLRSGVVDRPATWDRALSRWLPVARDLISADGSSYVWTGSLTSGAAWTVNEVDIASGRNVILLRDSGLIAVRYEPATVYLVSAKTTEAGTRRSTGLWRLELSSRVLSQIGDSDHYWAESGLGTHVFAGSAWRTDVDPADMSPHKRSSGGISQNRLVRFDLATGTTSYWLTRPGGEVAVIGSDASGDPLVSVRYHDTTEIRLMTRKDFGTVVYRGAFDSRDGLAPYDDGSSGGSRPLYLLTDAHGLWFSTWSTSSGSGAFRFILFTAGHLESVPPLGSSDSVHQWMPAGGCRDK